MLGLSAGLGSWPLLRIDSSPLIFWQSCFESFWLVQEKKERKKGWSEKCSAVWGLLGWGQVWGIRPRSWLHRKHGAAALEACFTSAVFMFCYCRQFLITEYSLRTRYIFYRLEFCQIGVYFLVLDSEWLYERKEAAKHRSSLNFPDLFSFVPGLIHSQWPATCARCGSWPIKTAGWGSWRAAP